MCADLLHWVLNSVWYDYVGRILETVLKSNTQCAQLPGLTDPVLGLPSKATDQRANRVFRSRDLCPCLVISRRAYAIGVLTPVAVCRAQ
jgi:hypothetical protein